jgi:hypothetical protein
LASFRKKKIRCATLAALAGGRKPDHGEEGACTRPSAFSTTGALHDSGAEETWWQVHGTDPLAEAKQLWQLSRNSSDKSAGATTVISGGDTGEPVSAAAFDAGEPIATTAE